MIINYCYMAKISSFICFCLAGVWLIEPCFLMHIWQISCDPSAEIIARRGGVLFLGLGLILYLSRHANPTQERNAIAIGMLTACSGLSLLGLYSFFTGNAGIGIWIAIITEAFLAMGFAKALKSRLID